MAETVPVAVVIPVFNRRLKLIKTLESVVAQTKSPTLLVVVDDGSTDGTGDVAEHWLARNAAFEWRVIHQANGGVSAARNTGFAQIGVLPLVCFLDSDDLWPRDFIAEGVRALVDAEDTVAAVADRVAERAGRRRAVQDLRPLISNPLLWLICNDGALLSCLMIRSSAARAAGLFVPGMLASEDSDFLLRLFKLGGAARSAASPVLFIRRTPLEPTEPPNLGGPSPDAKYLWATHLTEALQGLPETLLAEHDHLIRTALARRWADSAFASRRGQIGRSVSSLYQAIRWDPNWARRLRLIGAFLTGKRKTPPYFPTPLPQHDLPVPQNRD